MRWQEIKVTVDRCGVDAVSEIFYRLGAVGVVIEDPLATKAYIDENRWDYYELPEFKEMLNEDRVVILAYLAEHEKLAGQIEEMMYEFEALENQFIPGCHLEVKLGFVQEEDWANSWKAYFKPAKVGERIVIKPTWEAYQAEPTDLIIELDPGMAFGTGTHPTTTMCLRALEDLIQGDEKVYDVGCGSGVLAIAAAKLGAKEVLAIDLDETAVQVARQNVEDNQVTAIVEVEHGNLLDIAQAPADVIVANIIADIIIKVMPDVVTKLKPGGIFVASGIIDDRAADVEKALAAAGFQEITSTAMGGWVAFRAQRGNANG